MNGLVWYGLVFLLIIALAIGISSYDGVAVTVTEARAGTAMGMQTAFAVETMLNWILRAVIGGVFSGFAIMAYREARKSYGTWKRSGRRRRWKSGPNANFQQANSIPKLSKNDLMLLALARGNAPSEKRSPGTLSKGDFPNDDMDVEF